MLKLMTKQTRCHQNVPKHSCWLKYIVWDSDSQSHYISTHGTNIWSNYFSKHKRNLSWNYKSAFAHQFDVIFTRQLLSPSHFFNTFSLHFVIDFITVRLKRCVRVSAWIGTFCGARWEQMPLHHFTNKHSNNANIKWKQECCISLMSFPTRRMLFSRP